MSPICYNYVCFTKNNYHEKQLLNLNSHDAYTALGYAAGRFKVTVESSQVHTRLATFRQNCGRFKTETPVGIWFMRAHNDENKPMLLILAVGDELLNAVAVSPEEVELTRATEIRLNNECYTLQKDGDKISYALKEA